MRVFLLLALFAGLSAVAGETPILNPASTPPSLKALSGSSYTYFQIEKIQSFGVTNSVKTKKNIDLYLGLEQGSPWVVGAGPAKALSSEVPKAIQIFNACGLGFNQIHFIYLNYNSGGLDRLTQFESSSPYDPPFEYPLYQDMPSSLRPMVILNKQGYAESFNRDSIVNLTAVYNVPISKIQDISFVPSDTAFGYNARMMTQSSFSLLAHEMAHVIGNLEHIQIMTPNLMDVLQTGSMQEAGHAMSGHLESDQCNSIMNWGDDSYR